jgi:hypothetical protein
MYVRMQECEETIRLNEAKQEFVFSGAYRHTQNVELFAEVLATNIRYQIFYYGY